MDEDGLTLYIILFFVAFISGLALLLSAEGKTHTSHGMHGLPPQKENPDTTE
jgi:hypothetical protein